MAEEGQKEEVDIQPCKIGVGIRGETNINGEDSMTAMNPGGTRNLRGMVFDAKYVKSCLGSNT